MTDAGEKLETRALAWWRENGENACNTNDLVGCMRAELERAAEIAEHVAVGWDYSDVPELLVDKIAAAIRKLKE